MIDRILVLITAYLLLNAAAVSDELKFVKGDAEFNEVGEVLVESEVGNALLFQSPNGRIWPLMKDQIQAKTLADDEVEPLHRKQIGAEIRDELGKGFRVHEAVNFVLIYNTEKDYARWVAGLYRRLNRGFCNYWKGKFKLTKKPAFPLPVIIFKSQLEYHAYMKRDLGAVNPAMLAYYSIETNRVAMYDLTADDFRQGGKERYRRINEVLDNPRAIPMVATIIHEGTHQLMFNYGMQQRYADNPLWINEGMAMYFETPDLQSQQGWRSIGKINFLRHSTFLQYLDRRPTASLQNMLESNDGFRDSSAVENYAQAWAFNYFLLNRHEESFVEYLKHMSKKTLLKDSTKSERLDEFLSFFDIGLNELDQEFVRYIRKIGLSR